MITTKDNKSTNNSKPSNTVSLYCHIPFCDDICSYCVFNKLKKNPKYFKSYLDSLEYELSTYPEFKAKTIFIGGGTPTSLDLESLERLLKLLSNYIDRSGDSNFSNDSNSNCSHEIEFTIESNPENITPEVGVLLSKYHVNRVSLGIQTFNKDLRSLLNRRHTEDDVIKAVKILKDNNINNINFDFIYGIPTQTLEDIEKDINKALELNPTHLSFYALEIDRGSKLYSKYKSEVDQDTYADMFFFILEKMKKNNFLHYEVSNFAKMVETSGSNSGSTVSTDSSDSIKSSPYICSHNMSYWTYCDYYSAGLGATSFYDKKRRICTNNLTKYLNKQYDYQIEDEEDPSSSEFVYLMESFRLHQGVDLIDFKNRFQSDFLIKYKDELSKVKDKLELINDNKNIRIKEDYILIMNSILVELLHFNNDIIK